MARTRCQRPDARNQPRLPTAGLRGFRQHDQDLACCGWTTVAHLDRSYREDLVSRIRQEWTPAYLCLRRRDRAHLGMDIQYFASHHQDPCGLGGRKPRWAYSPHASPVRQGHSTLGSRDQATPGTLTTDTPEL